jgi:hypothetical protein
VPIIGQGGNVLMYDGIDVAKWPAGVQWGLVYTDGLFANQVAARARFPQAAFQTISAVGKVPAEWVDCEPGCVFPALRAVSLYKTWKPQGCRGVYFPEASRADIVVAARRLGANPQLFGADWTNVPHINPGEAETQWQNTPGFDISSIPGPVTPAPSPVPVPIPPTPKEADMRVVVATTPSTTPPQPVVTAGQHFLLFGTAYRYIIETPADITALVASLGSVVPLTGGFIANIPLMP